MSAHTEASVNPEELPTKSVAVDERRRQGGGQGTTAPARPATLVTLEDALREVGKYLVGNLNHVAQTRCPVCNVDMMTVGLVDIAYTFQVCTCRAPTYDHLVEQLWHRRCIAVNERRP